ncbi:hypothetical protein O7626_31615 [Micromonospora sp. WMMD1102]|uniref:hypothetical protein n=1 Tax=Micromonospora sp. WMMD1102 TaxID=3016105 RepID=UPI0024154B24|nr:hypothetical protein [Micromonospora sp. WMMD1102]MDG4790416.1 hypothetical protein [Micromonospora sp. WMMD1102]
METRRSTLASFSAVLLAAIVALTACGPGTSDEKARFSASTPPGHVRPGCAHSH